jgi:ABC-type branched-subunit amino acid transport system ATPase component
VSSGTALLSTRGVAKHFGGLKALDGVDMDVRQGSIHGLIGPNGSGKTTMLNVLSGVYAPTAGSISFAGAELANVPAHRIAVAGIARTFQNLRLFKDLSVLENVLIGRQPHLGYGLGAVFLQRHGAAEQRARERAHELVRFVGLGHRAEARAGDLPYGEQRLVEIARALALEPKLLLLDEPLVGMNPTEVDRVVELFARIRQGGCTLLLVEHSVRVVMSICEQITVLNFGRRIAEGTPAAIRADADVISAYLGQGREKKRRKA